jgi:hypothetical protein
MHLLRYLRRVRGQARRLQDLGMPNRYLPLVIPKLGPQIGQIEARLVMRVAGIRASVVNDDLCLRLPDGT